MQIFGKGAVRRHLSDLLDFHHFAAQESKSGQDEDRKDMERNRWNRKKAWEATNCSSSQLLTSNLQSLMYLDIKYKLRFESPFVDSDKVGNPPFSPERFWICLLCLIFFDILSCSATSTSYQSIAPNDQDNSFNWDCPRHFFGWRDARILWGSATTSRSLQQFASHAVVQGKFVHLILSVDVSRCQWISMDAAGCQCILGRE